MKQNHFWVLAWLAIFSTRSMAVCQNNELNLQWPMQGTNGLDWVINNYVDLQPGLGLRDYRGNDRTYEGHAGIDIDLPTFKAMDSGVLALAAEAGQVTDVQSNLYDRNFENPTGCGPWNHVTIRHANGYLTHYGHLMQNRVLVRVGDQVARGAPLGLIGSSGCSTTAHLHFEVRNCTNGVVDPFLNNMFANPPAYDMAFQVMDVTVRKGEFPAPSNDATMKDPQRDITSLSPGSRLGVGFSLSNGVRGDRLDVIIRRPDDSIFANEFFTLNGGGRHTWPRWWFTVPGDAALDQRWTIDVLINRNLVTSRYFNVRANRDAVVLGANGVTYQQNFESLIRDRYRAIQVDGSTGTGADAKFSAVFVREPQAGHGFHNLDSAGYQQLFDQKVAQGMQPLSIDSYADHGTVRYAGVFGPGMGGSWRAYHGKERRDHQRTFDQWKVEGFRPYAMSVAVVNGTQYYTAAYTNLPSTGWLAWTGATLAEYQDLFNQQTAIGRAPAHLDIYEDVDGKPHVAVIFTAEANQGAWVVRHGLADGAYTRLNEQYVGEGYHATLITSYMDGDQRRYAGIWRK